ncbi:MAG: hypothetical protein ACJ8GJ_14265 [Vitreoscilla sp.]
MSLFPRLVLLTLTLAVNAGVARAAQPVALLLPVTYEFDTSVLHKTKEACKLEDKLATDIGGQIQQRAGRPGTSTTTTGVVVRVTIIGTGGIGGGGWTGSKSLTVRAEEFKDGDLVRARTFVRKSRGGLAGPFEGTCGILEGISETLAKDIVGWTGTETDAAFDADVAARALAKAQASEAPASAAN